MLKYSMPNIPLGDCAIIAANLASFNKEFTKIKEFQTKIKNVEKLCIFHRDESSK